MSKIPVSESNLEISCPFLPAMTKASMLFPLQANRTCLPALIAVRQAPCSMLHAPCRFFPLLYPDSAFTAYLTGVLLTFRLV